MSRLPAVAGLLLLSACAVGPAYRPADPVPAGTLARYHVPLPPEHDPRAR